MLVQKDTEIKRLREKTIGGRGTKEPIRNANNSGIDSDDVDIISQVYQSNGEEDSSSDEDLERKKPKTAFQGESIDNTNRSFIKTVLIKYLECQANQQERDTLMMEKVLFTALKVSENEVKVIEAARLNNYNQGLMSYFYNNDKLVAHPMKPRAVNPQEKKSKRHK